MHEETVMQRLVKLFPEARKTTLREMLESRRVWVNGAVVRSLKQPVGGEDHMEVVDAAAAPRRGGRNEKVLAQGLRVVHFDAEILVVDKPAGLLTATDAQEKRPTAWRILTEYFRRQNSKNQVHLIHRLDRDASGLLVFARTWNAYAALKKQFFEHTITREYDVIVHGILKNREGRLENLLLEDSQGIVRVTEDVRKGKLAILDYQVVEVSKSRKLSHLKCRLFTGRKHQIRVQLKAVGHEVCGDPVYGKGDEPPGRLALHASHLGLAHPRGGKIVKYDSSMPESFGHLVRRRAP